VALSAIRGDKTLSELSEQFNVHQNQIQGRHCKLLDQAGQILDQGSDSPEDAGHKLKDLHA